MIYTPGAMQSDEPGGQRSETSVEGPALDVNLSGAFHCTQIVARELIAQGRSGRVIFITSLAEHVTGPAQVDYGASKGGLFDDSHTLSQLIGRPTPPLSVVPYG